MLISEGEAHALVCVEALAAGLGVIVNEESAANLDTSKEFISVIPNNKIYDMEYIKDVLEKNRKISILKREEIRKYAQETFDWQIISKEYLQKVGK